MVVSNELATSILVAVKIATESIANVVAVAAMVAVITNLDVYAAIVVSTVLDSATVIIGGLEAFVTVYCSYCGFCCA